MKLRLLCFGLVLLLLAAGSVLAWHWFSPKRSSGRTTISTAAEPAAGMPWFEEVTDKAGIKFRYFNAATPHNYIHETFGSGIGWIDYDNDGWLDLFCVQDGPVEPKSFGQPLPTNKLYRNRGDGTFADVTEKVGLARAGFQFGCAVGDYDNDGHDDLVVTYLGGLVLYHNEPGPYGSRHFVDVTKKAGGLKNPHTATSCAWGDIDSDGFLDLYVCNYVEIDLANHPKCALNHQGKRKLRQCGPNAFTHTTHKLFLNNGDGTFSDISDAAGISAAPPAPGLGVVMCDLDEDGKLDIFVANDLRPTYLFHNLGQRKFKEKSVYRGCGYDNLATPLAGMGIQVGDMDGSGLPSLFVTNYQNRPNIFFRNTGDFSFRDMSFPSGLGTPSTNRLAFGTLLFDADFDGWLDVAVANGHVERMSEELYRVPFAQKDQLFLGVGKGKFRDVSEQAGPYFQERYVGRGMALGDYDNDGWPDMAISNNNGGPAVLVRNSTKNENHWIVLELEGDGRNSNRNAIGSRVEIEAGGFKQVRFLFGGGSYLSASSRRLHIGLGKSQKADKVSVTWPSGERQVFRQLEGGKLWRLREGKVPIVQKKRVDTN